MTMPIEPGPYRVIRDKPDTDVLKALVRIREVLADRGCEVRAQYGVSLGRQFAELLVWRHRLGMGRSEYYDFELFRPEVRHVAGSYLSHSAWMSLVRVLNPRKKKADDSKLTLTRALQAANVPVPQNYAVIAAQPTSQDLADPEFVETDRVFSALPASGCVIKPDRSTWGIGVQVFNGVTDDHLIRLDGEAMDAAALRQTLLEQPGPFVVQQRLENHSGWDHLRLNGVATIRLVTYIDHHDTRLLRASVKFPVGNRGVDNFHAGGIAAPVDLDTGLIGAGVSARGLQQYTAHPQTGVTFAGGLVPDWQRVLDVAKRAAAAMPEYSTLGWDIAVTPTGPVVIEANSLWGLNIMQRPHRRGLWEGEFRQWCLERVSANDVEPRVRRWLGLTDESARRSRRAA